MNFEPHQLLERLSPYLPPGEEKTLWVGYSGGLDSTALLHALVQLHGRVQLQPHPALSGIRIKAVHVNHGLSPHADSWQQHCVNQCRALGIELTCESVAVQAQGKKGVEAAARTQRYDIFSKLMQPGDLMLLAHHQDDQAETLFLRLLRGAGSRGLAAMAEMREFAGGMLVRPLLGFSRQSLKHYGQSHGLVWIEDESNRDEQFDRNFLRQTILPQLEKRWPRLNHRWSRTAQVLRESEQVLADMAALDLGGCSEHSARLGWRVNQKSFTALSNPRRHNMLRYWCEREGLPRPENKHLEIVDQALDQGEAPVSVQWNTCQLRSYKLSLYLLPSALEDHCSAECQVSRWDQNQRTEIKLPDGSKLKVYRQPGGLNADIDEIQVRWRQGGERCHPNTRDRSQSLKKLLQEYELEPWLRDRVPLIYLGEELAAVGDLWLCRGFEAKKESQGLHFKWIYPASSTGNDKQ